MNALKAIVILAIAALVTHAAFTQWYEVGYWRIVAPLLALSFAYCLLAFLQRKPWSWRFVAWIAVAKIVINSVFWPEEKYFGGYLSFARTLIGFEMVVLAIVGAFMLHPSTKRWFSANSAS
jgi:hypothetical protein